MAEAKVVRINQSLYVCVPAAEARRLNLQEGQTVEIDVRPKGATGEDILNLKGKYKGQLGRATDKELWGDHHLD